MEQDTPLNDLRPTKEWSTSSATMVWFTLACCMAIAVLGLMCLYIYMLVKYDWMVTVTVIFMISVLVIELFKTPDTKESPRETIRKIALGIGVILIPLGIIFGSYLVVIVISSIVGVVRTCTEEITITWTPEHEENLGWKYGGSDAERRYA